MIDSRACSCNHFNADWFNELSVIGTLGTMNSIEIFSGKNLLLEIRNYKNVNDNYFLPGLFAIKHSASKKCVWRQLEIKPEPLDIYLINNPIVNRLYSPIQCVFGAWQRILWKKSRKIKRIDFEQSNQRNILVCAMLICSISFLIQYDFFMSKKCLETIFGQNRSIKLNASSTDCKKFAEKNRNSICLYSRFVQTYSL